MRADLIAAIRALRASATFTAVALLVLALGIGASTAIFSVVDAVVLRGLPFDEHDRLIAVGTRRPPPIEADPARDPSQLVSVAPQDFMDWDQRQQVFEAIAAHTAASVTLREPGAEPEDLRGLRATAALFDVLRLTPAIGRSFTAEHEVEGRHRVAVLSDALWRRRFGSDASIVGRTIPIEGDAYEVLGVLPPDVTYPVGAARATDLYVPYVVPASERIRNPHDHSYYLQVVGRLKPGTTMAQAEAQMDQIGAALRNEHAEWNKDTLVGARPLVDHIVGSRTKSWMLMLLGAVGLVLLIACVNVATLQLARATRARARSGRAGRPGRGTLAADSSAAGGERGARRSWDAARRRARVVGRAGPAERDAGRRGSRQRDCHRPSRAPRGRGGGDRHRHPHRHRPRAAVVEAGSDAGVEGRRARHGGHRAASLPQRAGRRRSGAGGGPAGGRRALHRQFRDADADRSGLRSDQRAHRAGVPAHRAGPAAGRQQREVPGDRGPHQCGPLACSTPRS